MRTLGEDPPEDSLPNPERKKNNGNIQFFIQDDLFQNMLRSLLQYYGSDSSWCIIQVID